MPVEGLKIVVGADVSQAVKGISDVGAEFVELSKSSQSAINIVTNQITRLRNIASGNLGFKDLERVNKLLAQSEKQLESFQRSAAKIKPVKIPVAGFDDFTQKSQALVKGSNSATQALTNLGRVAQDAPFGFIGIANNLNPLLESFQRLKTETGSAKGALSALGTSLTGAGGLGLALSVVTAAASFASIGMQQWGGKLFGASKEAEALKKRTDELKSAIDGAFQSTAQEASRVTALIAILKNENETRDRKLASIKELNSIAPENFKNLKLEGDAVLGLDVAYKQYLATLQTVVAAKIKQAQLEAKFTELLQLQGATLTSTEKKIRDMGKAFRESFNQGARGTAIGAELERIDKFGKQGTSGITSFLNGISDASVKGSETLRKQIERVQDDIKGLTDDLIELSPGIDVKIPGEKKVKEAFVPFMKFINDQMKKVDLIDIVLPPLPLEFQFLVDDSKNSLKFSNVKKQLEDRLKQFALQPSAVPLVLKQQIELDPNIKLPAGLRKEMEDEVRSQFASGTPLLFEVDAEGKLNVKIDATALKQQLQTEVAGAVQTALQNINSFIGESIGNAISGIGDAKDIFRGVFNFIAEGVKQIGLALIKMGLLFEGLQTALASLATRPELALALGIAAVALSQVIKNSFTGAREQGGPVSRASKYLVNEKEEEYFQSGNTLQKIKGGPQIFTPKTSGKILTKFQAINFAKRFNIPALAGGGVVQTPTFSLLGENGPEFVAPLATLPRLLGIENNISTQPVPVLRGKDIALQQARQSRYNRRNT